MKLAVVIPAFKAEFFEKTLTSLANQTDRDFTVYIGDDCSPFDLVTIVDRFRSRLTIHYTRFPTNIGAQRLVDQWTRCMTLIRDEDWIWFFSDDDLATPNCVETLRRHQHASPDAEVFRFNTATIDESDREIGPTVGGPDFETSTEMALHLLHGQRGNSMPDHVFSRAVYERKGGFVFTPFAQGADWATSILFSQDHGMNIVQDGLVKWRKGGASISSTVSKKRAATTRGHYAFIAWLLAHFEFLKTTPVMGVTYADMRAAADQNLYKIIVTHYRGIPPSLFAFHIRFLREHFGYSFSQSLRHLAHILRQRLRIRRYEFQQRRLASRLQPASATS